MWTGVSVVAKPTDLPVSVEKVKLRTRIDGSAEDSLVADLIKQAVARVDGPNGIGCAMMRQTWRKSLDGFPRGAIVLPGSPIKSIAGITYVDSEGAAQTLDPEDYQADFDREPVRVVPALGKAWPGTRSMLGAVKVDYVLGEEEADDAHPDLVAAVCLLVSYWYGRRETASSESVSEIPHGFDAIVEEHRRGRVGV